MSKNHIFQFKQFSVKQEFSAMKIGVDAVLLGAWVNNLEPLTSVLDIGTGTGVIALQIAQRTSQTMSPPLIHSIEIEESAYLEALYNMELSPWNKRMTIDHQSFQDYIQYNKCTYDLVISNPPYFNNSYISDKTNRNIARHTTSLSFDELLSGTVQSLDLKGQAAFIIPYSEETEFLKIAATYNLHPTRITRVKGNKNSVIKRSLLQLSFGIQNPIITSLTIEISRHNYTTEYKKLVKDFYLKM